MQLIWEGLNGLFIEVSFKFSKLKYFLHSIWKHSCNFIWLYRRMPFSQFLKILVLLRMWTLLYCFSGSTGPLNHLFLINVWIERIGTIPNDWSENSSWRAIFKQYPSCELNFSMQYLCTYATVIGLCCGKYFDLSFLNFINISLLNIYNILNMLWILYLFDQKITMLHENLYLLWKIDEKG